MNENDVVFVSIDGNDFMIFSFVFSEKYLFYSIVPAKQTFSTFETREKPHKHLLQRQHHFHYYMNILYDRCER
jgi:hypothetical protein